MDLRYKLVNTEFQSLIWGFLLAFSRWAKKSKEVNSSAGDLLKWYRTSISLICAWNNFIMWASASHQFPRQSWWTLHLRWTRILKVLESFPMLQDPGESPRLVSTWTEHRYSPVYARVIFRIRRMEPVNLATVSEGLRSATPSFFAEAKLAALLSLSLG